jgi:hypothetical protein
LELEDERANLQYERTKLELLRTFGTGIFAMDDGEDAWNRRADELFGEGKERAQRGSGGGKLSRSLTVTVRLDPKLNYLCELAARAQRRTKSSFIEWAIDNSLGSVYIPGRANTFIADEAETLWDVEEADRLAKLALNAPVLMTHEEQLIWKLVEGNGLIWRGQYSRGRWTWQTSPEHFRWDVYRENYPTFKRVAEGDLPKSDLPEWQEEDPKLAKPKHPFDDDLDVPF